MIEIAEVDAGAAVKTNIRILALVVVNALRGAQAALTLGAT